MTTAIRTNTPRAKAIAWAKRVAADPAIVYLDTETGGIGPGAEIVDLAILSQDGTVLLDTLVRPQNPIPADATAVHGIADPDVVGAPRWGELFPVVRGVLAGNTVCGFNAPFDIGMIDQVTIRAGFPILSLPSTCAMRAHADFAGVPGTFPGSFRWHSLAVACQMLDVPPARFHRARADAEACRGLVHAMARAG